MVSDEPNSTIAIEGLWHQLAARVRHRRVELGFKENAVAAHLGVRVEAYRDFESGGIRVPAALLAELR
jgi:transcriptional regulator with XRE-family HTH domain